MEDNASQKDAAPDPRPRGPEVIYVQKQKKSRLFTWLVVIFMLLGGLFFLSLVVGIHMELHEFSEADDTRRFREEAIEPSESTARIVVIDVNGVILDVEGLFGGFVRPGEVIARLRQAAEDENVRGVVLRIDSPGGGITASDVIYHEVRRTKEAGKKIIVFMGDIAASGGYYIAAPADHIMAHPTTITGSIGVIMEWWNTEGLFRKLGLKPNVIKSGEHKDLMSPARPMTEEEKKLLKTIVMEFYDRFVGIVAEGRKLKPEVVRTLADGRVYTAQQAKRHQLVDSIGYWEDCKKEVERLTGVRDPAYVRYAPPRGLLRKLLSAQVKRDALDGAALDALVRELRAGAAPRFHYLWKPEK